MPEKIGISSEYGLEHHGLTNTGTQYWNLAPAQLIELAVERGEGELAASGGFVAITGEHTGRSPNDKFTVQDDITADRMWWGDVNRPVTEEQFDRLLARLTAYYQGRDLFVQDVFAATHPDYQMPVRVVTQNAWHNLFARNMFVRRDAAELSKAQPEFTVIQAPDFFANPEIEGTNSSTFIIVSFKRKLVLIGGSKYAGEIKKSIFAVMNYILPEKGVLPMHCSANVNGNEEVALFFGLSGTGKTTLSSDPDRYLIGDDEHGWGGDGVFNFEGGCYAKVIRLQEEYEPLIYNASRRFGAILENVWIDPETREIDYDNNTYTENTRVSYPIEFLPDIAEGSRAGHPNHVFFLTADAFGVLPPISKLTREQAMYYFLSGYTSKLAGTERGLGKEPQATFSACFGAPFLPLHPGIYADMLGEKVDEHNATVWLINTGWTGGPYGEGERMHLPYTRAMVRAAMTGALDDAPTREDPIFGLQIPETIEGVPDEVLFPRDTWKDASAYDQTAKGLVERFNANFEQYKDGVSAEIAAAGPEL